MFMKKEDMLSYWLNYTLRRKEVLLVLPPPNHTVIPKEILTLTTMILKQKSTELASSNPNQKSAECMEGLKILNMVLLL